MINWRKERQADFFDALKQCSLNAPIQVKLPLPPLKGSWRKFADRFPTCTDWAKMHAVDVPDREGRPCWENAWLGKGGSYCVMDRIFASPFDMVSISCSVNLSINIHQPSLKTGFVFVKWDSTLHQHWKFEGETSHSVLLFCFWKSGFLAPMTNSQILRKFAWKFGFQISVIHSKFVVVEDLLLGPSTARLPVYRTVPQWLSVAVWASENGARLPGA